MKITVKVRNFERRFLLAEKSRKTGKPRWWTVNGQSLYNGTLHYRARNKVTKYFHNYLSKYILEQIDQVQCDRIKSFVHKDSSHKLSLSLDIYEVKKGKIPDVDNLWPWTKWFGDALQSCNVIVDDNPDIIIESGRKRYHWVDSDEERHLLFTISIFKC